MEDYRNSKQNQGPETAAPKPSTGPFKWMASALVLSLALTLGLGYGLYYFQNRIKESFQDLDEQLAELQETLPVIVSRVDSQEVQLDSLANGWKSVHERMGNAEQELEQSKVLVENVREEQDHSLTQLSRQLVGKADSSDLEQLQAAAANRFEAVDAKLDSVEAEVERGHQGLLQTRAELAELGIQVGENGQLIATSAEGLRALERRGEREYFRFTAKLYDPFRVGDMAVELRDTNRKKSRAKLRLSFDDKRIVRGRVAANQPLTFYVGQNRIPYEIVINDVEKGRIWGYVSVPARTPAVGAGAEMKDREATR